MNRCGCCGTVPGPGRADHNDVCPVPRLEARISDVEDRLGRLAQLLEVRVDAPREGRPRE